MLYGSKSESFSVHDVSVLYSGWYEGVMNQGGSASWRLRTVSLRVGKNAGYSLVALEFRRLVTEEQPSAL